MITGLLRVKNEARWIGRVVASLFPLCDRVLVMDDHSDDGTPELCAVIPGVTVLHSPFDGLNETRDKNWLLDQASTDTGWIVMIDGDEILLSGHENEIRQAMAKADAVALRVLYAWDSEDQIRTDGVYGQFRRASIFRAGAGRFESNSAAGFHCGNAPASLRYGSLQTDIPLLHLGYRDREDRIRKFNWYRSIDPGNGTEDGYRHIVQGDIPEVPATAALMHAGPLKLTPLEALCPVSA
jgi:glycosyltransferase involved in cell wall biosynthesis